MQSDIYYFKLFLKKIILHKSIIYNIHPLTKYRIVLYRNSSQVVDSMKNWVYAGNHNGLIHLQTNPLQIVVDNKFRTNFFTLKLIQIQYNLLKDHNEGIKNIQKQQIIGKHSVFIKNYIQKYNTKNAHYFQQQIHLSTDYILHYQIFVQKTIQGLNRIIQQHQRLNFQNRPRKGSQIQSVKSSAFSDKINQIQVKGQNRFSLRATQIMQNAIVGSQSQLISFDYSNSPNLQCLNLKKNKIIRTQNAQNIKMGRNNNLIQISTQKKRRPQTNQQFNKYNINKQQRQNEQQHYVSPPSKIQAIQLKKLISQEINKTHQIMSPKKLFKFKQSIKKDKKEKVQSLQEKKKKLLQQFQLKRLQFKKKLDLTKQLGIQIPAPLTDRNLKRSSSTRSMKSVRLSEWEKLPQQKPWFKKQKQQNRLRNKIMMYVLIILMMFLLYIAMQPNKNQIVEQQQPIEFYKQNKQLFQIKTQKKVKQKKTKQTNKKAK